MEMKCPGCDGTGCAECENDGAITITRCPLELITADVWEIITLAELFVDKGLPPIAGGTLDQAKVFVETAYFILHEQRYWKKKLGIFE